MIDPCPDPSPGSRSNFSGAEKRRNEQAVAFHSCYGGHPLLQGELRGCPAARGGRCPAGPDRAARPPGAGQHVVSASWDHTLKVWELASGRAVAVTSSISPACLDTATVVADLGLAEREPRRRRTRDGGGHEEAWRWWRRARCRR